MGRKLQIAVAAVIVLMLGAAVGAYAWDNSRSDEIAEGITIGGVDVSGMTADEARKVVDAKLVEPLQKHVTVDFEGVKYKLSPERLEVSSDVDGMVDRAIEESQEGGLPVRVFRYATGGEVDVAISPQLSYSNKALNEFIAKVAAEVNRDPIDASIEPTATSLSPVEGQDGVAVVEDKLRAKLESAVQSPTERRVALPVERVKPEVTTDELAAQYPTYLTVNRSSVRAEPLEGPRAGEDLHGRDRRRGLRHSRRRLQHPEQGGRPGLERPRLRLGRRPRRDGRARRGAGEPAQGALDGNL